jgi:molecular chaperone DnaJ
MAKRDYYEVLGVEKEAPRPTTSSAPTAGWPSSITRTKTRATRRPRPSSRNAPRPTRSSATTRNASVTTSTATKGCAGAGCTIISHMNVQDIGDMFGDMFGDIFGDIFGGGRRGGRAADGAERPRGYDLETRSN